MRKKKNNWSLEFWNVHTFGWVFDPVTQEKIWMPTENSEWKTSINTTPFGKNPYPTLKLALQALAFEQTARTRHAPILEYRIRNAKTGEIIPGEIFV